MIKKFQQFLNENKNWSDKEYQKWSDIVWDFMISKNLEPDSVEGYQKLFDYLMKQQNLGNKIKREFEDLIDTYELEWEEFQQSDEYYSIPLDDAKEEIIKFFGNLAKKKMINIQ